MRLRLRITLMGQPATERELVLDAVKIGRMPSSDLPIPDDRSQTVSWQHARIDTTAEGAWLHDLRSTNGTFLNGRKVEQPERLRRGDTIRFGQTGPILEVLDLEPHYQPATVNLPPTGSNSKTPPPPPLVPLREAPPMAVPSKPAPSGNRRAPVQEHAPSPGAMSATRAMLVGMQKKNRVLFGSLVSVLLVAGVVIGIILWRQDDRLGTVEEQIARINELLDLDTDADTVETKANDIAKETQTGYAKVDKLNAEVRKGGKNGNPEAIYQRAVLSTAWVITNRGEGTGTVIDHGGKKLIVTAYHVIDQASTHGVIFPKFHNGKMLASRSQYVYTGSSVGRDTLPCSVWASDPTTDLAILDPKDLPTHIPALKLADDAVEQATKVHTIGAAPAGTIGLWSYTQSEVRSLVLAKFKYSNGQEVNANVIETANEVTFGDSGGPLLNNKAELVGVTSGGNEGKAAVARFIDLSHVRDLLAKKRQQSLPPPPTYLPDPPTKQPVKDPKPPIVKKNPELKIPDIFRKKGNDPVPPPTRTPSGMVHVLFAIDDTDPKLAPGVRANLDLMKQSLAQGLPENSYKLTVLQGKGASSANIMNHYRSLNGQVSNADTLMFYYAGHGACDPNAGGHFITMNGGGNVRGERPDVLHRGKIIREMQRLGGKLHVVLSDCCSSDAPGIANIQYPYTNTKFLVPLLMQHRGLVDWQGASPTEYGWYGKDGGVYTRHLRAAMVSSNHTTWATLFRDAQQRTIAESAKFCPTIEAARKVGQKQQTPYSFAALSTVHRE